MVNLFVSGSRAPQIARRDPIIHYLPEEKFVEELCRFSTTPEAVLRNAEFMRLFSILRLDFALHETYVYAAGEPLDCSIFAFGGREDERVSHDELAAWRQQTRGAFMLRMLPGDHFFLRSAQSSLLQAVSQDLAQLLRQITGGQHQ